ncbi:hypothetical protein BOTBODRAFT_26860 [Botryobasidium botryosum FD-172 SS1]|uniref:Aquaporin n=1 Tax=Botryobasidium botryosum (strain FD-172 SS1) TaxID=930990 RepID=A0A067N1P4_BOTB1|nr:hypothetical protein BOTBODRAFT_26860 [Botryobasidium botryosum FD-172 SS1]
MKNLRDYAPNTLSSENMPPIIDKAASQLRNVLRSIWALKTTYWAEFLSIFIMTVAFIMFGCQLSEGLIERGRNPFSAYAGMLGPMAGLYIGAHSGGFGNPILTIGLASAGRLSPKKVPIYLAMQFTGALLGAAAAYAYYSPAIDAFEGGPGIRTVPGSAKFFTAIYYAPDDSPSLFNTLSLIRHMTLPIILVLGQSWFIPNPTSLRPGAFMTLYFEFYHTVGHLSTNPARDVATCLVLHLAGYGRQVWTQGNVLCWPAVVIGTTAAAITGARMGPVLSAAQIQANLENQVIETHKEV